MQVREIMRSDVVTVGPGTPATQALATMERRGFRHLPVVHENGELAGILSDRDLRDVMVRYDISQKGLSTFMTIGPLAVSAVMVPDPLTVGPLDDVRTALMYMYDGKFSSLPIVRDGKLVGIVTLTDMLRLLYKILSEQSA